MNPQVIYLAGFVVIDRSIRSAGRSGTSSVGSTTARFEMRRGGVDGGLGTPRIPNVGQAAYANKPSVACWQKLGKNAGKMLFWYAGKPLIDKSLSFFGRKVGNMSGSRPMGLMLPDLIFGSRFAILRNPPWRAKIGLRGGHAK